MAPSGVVGVGGDGSARVSDRLRESAEADEVPADGVADIEQGL